jgi:hypothetical protein
MLLPEVLRDEALVVRERRVVDGLCAHLWPRLEGRGAARRARDAHKHAFEAGHAVDARDEEQLTSSEARTCLFQVGVGVPGPLAQVLHRQGPCGLQRR